MIEFKFKQNKKEYIAKCILGKFVILEEEKIIAESSYFDKNDYSPLEIYIPQSKEGFLHECDLTSKNINGYFTDDNIFFDFHMICGNICFVSVETIDLDKKLIVINLEKMIDGILEIYDDFKHRKLPYWLSLKEIVDISCYDGPLTTCGGLSMCDDMFKITFFEHFEI